MRNSMNPYGGVNPLIDKMIGNAYDIVKYVARYLKEIRYVAENMQYVYTAANGNRTVIDAVGNGTGSLSIPLEVGLNIFAVESITVVATASGGSMYFPGPGTFTYEVVNSETLVVTISNTVALANADFRVVVTQPAGG